ncbi:hypothetical protein D3C84_1079770 [compost metagenome]
MASACLTMASSGRNCRRNNQPPNTALSNPHNNNQIRLPSVLSQSLVRANFGLLSTSTRAACSQPRMISASPPCGCRLTRLTNQPGTFSTNAAALRSTSTCSFSISMIRMLLK